MRVRTNNADVPLTVALLGRNGVGKTALAARLVGDEFRATDVTHGSATLQIGLDTPGHEESTVDLIDFGGMPQDEIVRKIKHSLFGVAIVVVDPADHKVKDDAAFWGGLADEACGETPCQKLLVLGRVDRGGDITSLEEMRPWAKKQGYADVIRTSARTSDGIQALRSTVNAAVRSLSDEEKQYAVRAALVVRTLAETFCRLIADDPNFLRHTKWLDLERLIAEALDELGFDVELTPESKDGGKDVVAKCYVKNEEHTFYVEIKHWQHNRPNMELVQDFIQVNATDETDGGLFLSSSGFTKEVHERIGEISRQKIRLGEEEKIVALCKRYVKSKQGVWESETPLPELLFADTLSANTEN